ncbi:dUTP diphosphatase [Sorangium sp. So ce134]
MTDLLPAIRSLAAALSSADRATLERAAAEIEHLRRQRDELQACNTRVVQENRDLRAQLAGRPVVRVKRVGDPNLQLPEYATAGAAGLDLRADLSMLDSSALQGGHLRIPAGCRVAVPCGFAFEIPPGYVGLVMGRSGWTERGVYVAHGVIDPDYRGVVGIHVENRSSEEVEIAHGNRIAQLVVVPAMQVQLEEAKELAVTARGTGRYGSTGVR